MKDKERVVINISYKAFEDTINSVLERNFYDDDCWRVVPEIVRVLKIRQRKEQVAAARLANLQKALAARKRKAEPIVIENKTWWRRFKLWLK